MVIGSVGAFEIPKSNLVKRYHGASTDNPPKPAAGTALKPNQKLLTQKIILFLTFFLFVLLMDKSAKEFDWQKF